jgi:hypothetical protein
MFEQMAPQQSRLRKRTGSDRLPHHWSESPIGYSSTGCSPAEPVPASPVAVNGSRSGSGIKRAAQPHH